MPKPRTTCTECSSRRQKCDRNIPCDRCIKRGVPDLCTLTWSDSHDPRPGGRLSARAQSRLNAPRSSSNGRILDNHAASLDLSRQGINARHVNGRDLSSPAEADHDTVISINEDDADGSDDGLDVTRATSSRLSNSVTPSGPEAHSAVPISPTRLHSFGFARSSDNATAILQLQLPSIDQIWHLVDYHERYLLWYHGCYHGPTFRQELTEALDGFEDVIPLDDLNLQWAALLFSIMAGSMACANNRMISSWGFWKGETTKLARQWYKATITCLNASEYTMDHQIYAVHAITTLSMSAHTLGLSEDLSVLLGAALQIARSLGLDRLKSLPALENINDETPDVQRQKVLRREIGRRLWSQLCVQDWFALPFAESQCISLTDFTTSKPSNRNHITMASLPESFPTYISYGNYLYDIAKLIAEHHTAMTHSSTPFTKYEQVLEHDARMRDLARKGMPKYFHVTAEMDPSWPEFIPWARRSLTICFAHKMIMIHKSFIRPSFTNPAFQLTRVTCIAAAKTILKEAKQEQEEDGPIIWIDQAFCIAAGIILCLDIIHRSVDDLEYRLHVDLVTGCIGMLRKFEGSMIAFRGINLLSTLLAERKKMTQPYPGTAAGRKRPRASGGVDIATPPGSSRLPKRRVIELAGVLHSLSMHGGNQDGTGRPPPHLLPSSSGRRVSQQAEVEFEIDCEAEVAFKKFAELFPPQAGFSNNFLFGTLLDFQ